MIVDRPRGCRHVRTCPGGRPEPRTGRNGSQPRPRGTRGAKSGRGGEIPREEMTNTTRVGPEQAFRGRGRCRGVAPTPTDEAEASGWPRHGVLCVHGDSDTSKNRRKSANASKEATSRCRARGRTRCCSGATVGGASDVGPPAAARGTQGAASYIIRGVRVVSMAKNSSKQAGLETDVTRCRHHAARRARARSRRDRV